MKSKATIINSVILTLSLAVFLGVPMLTNAQSLEPITPGIQDDYHNLIVFTTDNNGSYAYTIVP